MKTLFKRIFILILLTSTTALIIYYALAPHPILVEMQQVRRGTFHEIIRTDGILRSKESYIISAFAEGDIKRIDLKVGDRIKKGQSITEIFWDMKYEPLASPMDGVISQVFRESAGPVRRGEPLVKIINPKRLEVVLELLTSDATRVSNGDLAVVDNWGGEQPLKGVVQKISQAGFKKLSALGVEEERTEVTLDLLDIPERIQDRLGSTFHVDVSIEISTTPHVLIIPEGALYREGNEWAVYTVKNTKAHSTQITVYARGDGLARIGNELREGDWVIIYPGDLIQEGTQVRIREKNSTQLH